MTPKLVVFSMMIGTAHPETEVEPGQLFHFTNTMVIVFTAPHTPSFLLNHAPDHDKLHDMVRELSEALYNVKREQEYMEHRERTHRKSWCPASIFLDFLSLVFTLKYLPTCPSLLCVAY